ncbi:MAG: alpha/beta hydrolase [Candidatus Atribacteria bacterium]|nr:MAG: alpha/beta hydrolase [Candidatus Atribacteria bacterium]
MNKSSHSASASALALTLTLTLALFLSVSGCSIAQQSVSGYLRAGNDSIFYETAGSGSVIVLIHDGLLPHNVWDDQFFLFSKSHRVIRYDRRGHGKSSPATGSYTDLDDLADLFTELKIDSASLIGCSSGGALAINFTLQYPQKVTSLVLVGAVVSGFSYTTHFKSRGGHLPPGMTDPMETSIYYASEDPYSIYYENSDAREKALKIVKKYPQRFSSFPRYVSQPVPAYRRLNEIRVPALILIGEYDIPDVHAHSGVINAGIRNSTRVIIPNSGHLIPLEQPVLFNEAVMSFLD